MVMDGGRMEGCWRRDLQGVEMFGANMWVSLPGGHNETE